MPANSILLIALLLAAPVIFVGERPAAGDRVVVCPFDPLLDRPRGRPAVVVAAAEGAGAHRLPEVRAYAVEAYRLASLVGLDPAIIVAQSAHETGFWRSAAWDDYLNPAGLGITGPDAPSPTWANGTDAARAQVVHLYLYAVGEIPPDHLLAPYVSLDPRYAAALGAGRAGVAATIADLAGRWAVDPRYAEGIARAGSALFAHGSSPALTERVSMSSCSMALSLAGSPHHQGVRPARSDG